MSQQEIAEQLGISQSTYNSWENDRSAPKVTHYVRLATLFGIDLKDLIPANLTVIIPSIDQTVQEPTELNAQQLYEDLTASQKQLIQFQQQRIEHLEAENQQLRQQIDRRSAEE